MVGRRQGARLVDPVALGDHFVGGHGHQGIEVGGGAPVDQVAVTVRLLGMDQGEVSAQGRLQGPLAPRRTRWSRRCRLDLGLKPDIGQKAVMAGAGTADLFRQQALGMNLNVQPAGIHLLDGDAVEADMGGDQPGQPGRLRSAD